MGGRPARRDIDARDERPDPARRRPDTGVAALHGGAADLSPGPGRAADHSGSHAAFEADHVDEERTTGRRIAAL
ncbi:hypothetical protein ABZV24_43305 [Streptomyces sp. NPDC005251]|uniref:hypothetical protein n=1 Tax=Streptomyces sp. NPDC005251 TaxID=3157166 RepID=UPI0033B9C2FD